MTEKTFHTVSWAPSAIKDAVEHASEAFKAAQGPYARVSAFELSALIDTARALIERNEWLESMPKVVCLSGSMRFEREMRVAAVDLSLEGHIVTGPFVNMKQPDPRWATDELADPIKVALDALHFRKIDLADEVVVVSDESGYIGDSTRNEIAYAEKHGKPVRHVQISLPVVAPELQRLTAEVERLRSTYDLAERQYAEQTEELKNDRDRYKAAHESTQRGLIRMEVQRDEARSAADAIRVALRDVGEDAVPPSVTTLSAVKWLIGEHKRLAAQNEELGAEVSVIANERDEALSAQALAEERIALTRKALRLDDTWSVQHGALAVRSERDRLREALVQHQALLSRAVLVWPQDAMVLIRECIADPSRMLPRGDETVAGWGARAVVKLMESWRVFSTTPAAEGAPSATSEAAPAQHVVRVEPYRETLWDAACVTPGCGQHRSGTEKQANDWKDQHEADTLRPVAVTVPKVDSNVEGLRPSGSEAAEPRSGIELIANERARQVAVEGWTPEHDATHNSDDLAMAAVCYSLPVSMREMRRWNNDLAAYVPVLWPWHPKYWKSNGMDRIRDLAKGGALIAAEIDRIQVRDAASAARSEATPQIVCAEDCPAEDPECRCTEEPSHRTCCHSPAVAVTKAEPSGKVDR